MPLKLPVRAALFAAVLTMTLVLAPSALAWKPPPAVASGVVKTTNIPVRMSDGVVLYVDVVRPAGPSGRALSRRLPVLLTQTPYNKNAALSFEDDYLVEHGFVQVIADAEHRGPPGQRAVFGEHRVGHFV